MVARQLFTRGQFARDHAFTLLTNPFAVMGVDFPNGIGIGKILLVDKVERKCIGQDQMFLREHGGHDFRAIDQEGIEFQGRLLLDPLGTNHPVVFECRQCGARFVDEQSTG